MTKKIKKPEADPKEMFETKKLKRHKLIPNLISKLPKHKTIPPIRTLPLAMQMELTTDMPDSIIDVLTPQRPTAKLKQWGIPAKIAMASDRIDELCLISSYLVSENPNISNNYLELYIDHKQMFFWLMAMAFKPNNPYLAVFSAEENSSSASVLAAYLANYYKFLSGKQGNEMLFKWYRSLEFVNYKTPIDEAGVIIIQCRWPSWVDNREKLLRNILNIRATYENAIVILIMQEEDLTIAPYLLNDEPFGVFLKVGKKSEIDDSYSKKPPTSPINTIMRRIKRHMKK